MLIFKVKLETSTHLTTLVGDINNSCSEVKFWVSHN